MDPPSKQREFLIPLLATALREYAKAEVEKANRESQKRIDHFDSKCVEKYNEGIKVGLTQAAEIARNAIQTLGAPVMDYAAEYAVKEYDKKIKAAVDILMPILQSSPAKEETGEGA